MRWQIGSFASVMAGNIIATTNPTNNARIIKEALPVFAG